MNSDVERFLRKFLYRTYTSQDESVLWEAIGPDAVDRDKIPEYSRKIAQALYNEDAEELGQIIMAHALDYINYVEGESNG